jgi:hypothetical protein
MDGDPCTDHDTCEGGTCTGTPVHPRRQTRINVHGRHVQVQLPRRFHETGRDVRPDPAARQALVP